MHIILADGTQLNHIGATGGVKFVHGASRDTITFEFGEIYSVDELREYFSELNCETINIVADGENNYHEGYVIRAEVSEKIKEITPATGTEPAVTERRVFVTMAQRTYSETQVASLTETVDYLVLESLMA